jgi:hypothetical protein
MSQGDITWTHLMSTGVLIWWSADGGTVGTSLGGPTELKIYQHVHTMHGRGATDGSSFVDRCGQDNSTVVQHQQTEAQHRADGPEVQIAKCRSAGGVRPEVGVVDGPAVVEELDDSGLGGGHREVVPRWSIGRDRRAGEDGPWGLDLFGDVGGGRSLGREKGDIFTLIAPPGPA